MQCPHCKSKTRIRTSEEMSPLSRKQYRQCINVCCGHTFTVMNEIFETIAPSRCPDPTIKIPLSSYIGRFLPNQESALKRKPRNSKNKTNDDQLALRI